MRRIKRRKVNSGRNLRSSLDDLMNYCSNYDDKCKIQRLKLDQQRRNEKEIRDFINENNSSISYALKEQDKQFQLYQATKVCYSFYFQQKHALFVCQIQDEYKRQRELKNEISIVDCL